MKSSFLVIHVTASRAETAFASIRNKFKFAAIWAGKKGFAIRGITAMNHLIYIFNNSGTLMRFIKDMFIIITKNSL